MHPQYIMSGMDDGDLQCYILDTLARIDGVYSRATDTTDECGERDELEPIGKQQKFRLKQQRFRWKIRPDVARFR